MDSDSDSDSDSDFLQFFRMPVRLQQSRILDNLMQNRNTKSGYRDILGYTTLVIDELVIDATSSVRKTHSDVSTLSVVVSRYISPLLYRPSTQVQRQVATPKPRGAAFSARLHEPS